MKTMTEIPECIVAQYLAEVILVLLEHVLQLKLNAKKDLNAL